MEHEKNTRSKPGSVSSRGKGGKRENQRINRQRKIATSQTMASYAACMLRHVQNDSLFHYRGLRYCIGVRTNCFLLPYSFRAADIINTGPPMGNSSVRSHELSASAPQESKWDVFLIDPRENNIRIFFYTMLYKQTENFYTFIDNLKKFTNDTE